MHSLPIFLRLSGRPVILAGDGPAAAAKRRLLERAGARVVGPEQDAAIAIVAIADEAEAQAVIARLKARGILVNAVDRPAACDFTLPAIVDRDPVLIAIGTGGASAGLAKALRQRFEVLLPAGLGGLAARLHAARARLRARWPDAGDRRRAIDAALEAGGPLDPLGPDGGDDALDRWMDGGDPARPALEPIILRSADPDALTLRQARLLGAADHLFHRPDVPAAILDRARADAVRTPCAAAPAQLPPGLSVDISMEPR
ncbi:MAG: siroheme synthase [Sphingomonas sp. SCN 67-18]|uniref:precorrin-2 dehydrogenase/sirohydrochlorin ferrochelatase family protein n=1 Tax=uncultured Sphingomonas sp. TaxID=158754 RepID=UPI00086D8178|nr:NAD(P)-dependent oxidoreductase [Sphingomonas sp. SCN 67-18]ODU21787.1 MAG: siroheme synthase [Sphingomonas sp. SCN 67-18]